MFKSSPRKLKRLKRSDVPEDALRRQRARLLSAMEARPIEGSSAFGRGILLWKPALAVLLLFTMLAGTGGAVMAAQDALPGETLYPVKLASEEMRLRLAASADARFRLNADRAERRLTEARALMGAEDDARVRGRETAAMHLEEAMSRYETHVEDLRVNLRERNGRAPQGVMMEAIDRILVKHGLLVDSATTTGSEDREIVRRRAAASARLGMELIGDDGREEDRDEERDARAEKNEEEDGEEKEDEDARGEDGKKRGESARQKAKRFRTHLEHIRAMAEAQGRGDPGPPAEAKAKAKLELRL